MTPALSAHLPEFELLLAAARFPLDSNSAATIHYFADKQLDWSRLVALAKKHNVLLLLVRHLQTVCPEKIPAAVLAELKERAADAAAWHLRLTSELLALHDSLLEIGIPMLPYKGPALSLSLYGELGLRPSADLDILVPRHDVQAAVALLEKRGYALPAEVRNVPITASLRVEKDYHMAWQDGLPVELHWKLAPRYFRFDYDMQTLWDDPDQFVISGRTIPMIRPEALLLILAVHGSRHYWEGLIWIVDIAQLLRRHPEIDIERVSEQAKRYGAYRMLLLALHLARELLDAPLNAVAAAKVDGDRIVPALARDVCARLATPRGIGLWEGLRIDLRMKERLRDRLGYILALAFAPTLSDLNLFRLPNALFPLYWPLRPVSLFLRHVVGITAPW